LRRPMRPIFGFSSCAARSRISNALAPLLVASAESRPSGSPNLSARPFARTSTYSKDVAVIDLRSDTVTMPTPEMRRAMVESTLGDDVFGDDPTTNRLLEVAAARMGKEAATFVPSGTMGNLIGVAVNAHSGEELIADSESHI